MEDTTPEMYKIRRSFLMNKTDSERFFMSVEMYEMFKAFVKSSILNEHPNISERELCKEIFKRFYKNDFSKDEMEKILLSF